MSMASSPVPLPGSPNGPTAVSLVGFRNAGDVRQCISKLQQGSDQDFVVLICENGGRLAFDNLVGELSGLAAAETACASQDPHIEGVWRGRLPGGQIVEALCAKDNLGFAGGVNATIFRLSVHAGWSALWVLNTDTEPEPQALAALVEKASSDPNYGIVGSRLVLYGTGKVQAYGGRWRKYTARGYNIGLNLSADANVDADAIESEMDYVLGASMYVTRRYIDEIGVMADDYFLYAEEIDWCLRRGRFRLGLAANSIIQHHHGSTIGSSLTTRHRSFLSVFLDERNKHLIARRLHPALYPLIAFNTLALTGQYLLKRSPQNFAAALAGWWAGLLGQRGRPAWVR